MSEARIVFDLDGTLIDSAPDIHGVANLLLREEGLEEITLEQTRSFIGNGVGVLVEKVSKLRGIPQSEHERLASNFISHYDTAVHLTHPYPGTVQALKVLKSAGHRLGICTNKPFKPTIAVLEHLGIDTYFDSVFGGDTLPVRKPDPEPLHATFKALGKGPKIYVGDSDVDAETADRGQVPFLLFTEGYRKSAVEDLYHTRSFDHFDALPTLVERSI